MRYLISMLRLFILVGVSLMPGRVMAQLYDVVVAQDGSGDYYTIQEAVNSIRDYKPEGRQRIWVRNGVYEEKVIIPSYKTNISLIGESCDSVILVWHDHANMRTATGFGSDPVRITNPNEGRAIGTFQTYTLRVDGPGFECENMTIQNDAMTYHNPSWKRDRKNAAGVGQAVALHVEADRSIFRNCRILGFQDTVFNGNADSRQMFYRCYIEGTVDFIFGPATCWFEQCQLHALTDGYLTAPSTPAHHTFGYVFNRCRVTADPAVKGVWLGRPWRNWGSTIFKECELPAVIHPEGWHNWNDPARERTARFAEYRNTGEGARPNQRVRWARPISEADAARITSDRVFLHPTNRWSNNAVPASFYDLHFAFYDENTDRGTPYKAGTLEPARVPDDPAAAVEPLVMKFDSVDCTTFVEYMSAALLGRVYNPTPGDSIMQRFVQALRYRGGIRGNYATRKHYFSEWISDNEQQGLLRDISGSLPGSRPLRKTINFMSSRPRLYPQLAASPELLRDIQATEREISRRTVRYIPNAAIRSCYRYLREGDIVAFVTTTEGLDVQHVGFVWCRDPKHDEPQILHASSQVGKVCISFRSLADYARELYRCQGIRVLRLLCD